MTPDFIYNINPFSTLWPRELKSFLTENKDWFVPQSQHHGCWWPGDTWSQGISSHGIHIVLSEYSALSTRRSMGYYKFSVAVIDLLQPCYIIVSFFQKYSK